MHIAAIPVAAIHIAASHIAAIHIAAIHIAAIHIAAIHIAAMHYKKTPRLKETEGSPPGGSALHLRRVGKLRTTAGGMFRKITSKPLEARFARSADVGRHSFSRNSRRAVLALKGSLRRAKEGAPLTAAGRSALLSAKKEWGSPEWRRHGHGLGQVRGTYKFRRQGSR